MSKYPVLTSGRNPTEFILTEANGQRSRDNAFLAHPSTTITVGQLLQKTAEPTTDKFGTYVPATTGANAHAIALYGGVSTDADGLKIAILTRDCEVNHKIINWGALSNAEKGIAMTTLAARGIIVRD